MNPVNALLVVLGLALAWYLVALALSARHKRHEGWPRPVEYLIGAVTDFFDTLGVGSFAPTTAAFRGLRLVPDEWIPGTLNIGHLPPTMLQAFFFIGAVQVDPATLLSMVGAAGAGAWIGASFVAGWDRRRIQLGMGFALLCGAALFVARNLGWIHIGGTADGAEGAWLAFGIVVNFLLGALMTIGVGLYAPCMVLVSVIGMNERAAFPIMMGSCALLMAAATPPFAARGAYSLRAALGLAIGGLPAVWVAATFVRELPLDALRWLIAAVVLYTGVSMLRAATAKN
jgi:uncharacterized membrane protein YfcA